MATVLMVEDDDDNLEIYRAYFHHIGHVVLTAGDAEKGLVVARDERPHLILMDLALPGMDGFEAVRKLKADSATSSIPVVALSAHFEPDIEAHCRALGCDEYLMKPIAPGDVAAAVDRFLAHP